MEQLLLHEFHQTLRGRFGSVSGVELVTDYGDLPAEHAALSQTVGALDLSFRSRLCLTGADRIRFLHGQVTNDVKKLQIGEGCYAALVTAKGRMQSDLHIYNLTDELLLDFEPGLVRSVTERLEKFLVADDVQVVDIAPHYGLLSVQGPQAALAARALGLFSGIPEKPFDFVKAEDAQQGEVYLTKQPRVGTDGFDLFVPVTALGTVADKLITAVRSLGGCACGWEALETARIEAGIPRFGLDMDETNLPHECGIEGRAVSYTKGCYIGQEVLNRVHTMGHVNRELRGLELASELKILPQKGDKLFRDGREIGFVTSSTHSPLLKKNIALGYIRREVNESGTQLKLISAGTESWATAVELPFKTR